MEKPSSYSAPIAGCALLLAGLISSSPALAYVVDSGSVTNTGRTSKIINDWDDFNEFEGGKSATSFTLDKPTYVSSVETWMNWYARTGATQNSSDLVVSIFDATGQVSGYESMSEAYSFNYKNFDNFEGNLLFSDTYNVASNEDFHWESFSINTMLEPGQYWFELSAKQDDEFVGYVADGAENKVGETFTRFEDTGDDAWVKRPDFNAGLRVSGSFHTPEIDTAGAGLALSLLAGLAFMFSERRRQHKNS